MKMANHGVRFMPILNNQVLAETLRVLGTAKRTVPEVSDS